MSIKQPPVRLSQLWERLEVMDGNDDDSPEFWELFDRLDEEARALAYEWRGQEC